MRLSKDRPHAVSGLRGSCTSHRLRGTTWRIPAAKSSNTYMWWRPRRGSESAVIPEAVPCGSLSWSGGWIPGGNSPSVQQPDRSRDTPLPAIGHRQTENGYRLYRVAESNWLLRPNNGGLPQRWREGRAPEPARCCGVRLSVRWSLSCQLLGRQCQPESGQKPPPIASPTSTTTSP